MVFFYKELQLPITQSQQNHLLKSLSKKKKEFDGHRKLGLASFSSLPTFTVTQCNAFFSAEI